MKQVFFTHNAENERAPRDVNRSSAVFYFKCTDEINTEIHYLNYWIIKRGISDVKRRVTLRSLSGEVFASFEDKVEEIGSQLIDVATLVKKFDIKQSEGSVEIEFLSSTNLFVAYPALVVRYCGVDWHTVAHSSQRYFDQTSGDRDFGNLGLATEGNLTIQEGRDVRPFLILHNGPNQVRNPELTFTITAPDGEELSVTRSHHTWRPYETCFIYLDEMVNFHDFLRGRFGTFKIEMPTLGVFPRLIGGCERSGVWSIDHTNFAATDGSAAADLFQVDQTEPSKSLVFTVPNNVDAEWKCFTDVYPTFPSTADYEIEMNKVATDGSKKSLQAFKMSKKQGERFQRIEIDNSSISADSNIELNFLHEQQLPRRFHLGIHYKIGEGLSGFLTDGPLPFTTPGIRTRWFPVFDLSSCENFLLLSYRTLAGETDSDVSFDVELYNSFGDSPQRSKIKLSAHSQKCLKVQDIFSDSENFLDDGPGWVYMVSPIKQRTVVHYASVMGENSIAVCHAF